MLSPFAVAAVAINLFLGALVARAAGWGSLSPLQACLLALPLGVPASWASGLWVRSLLDKAAGP